jgi:hypothetical protein
VRGMDAAASPSPALVAGDAAAQVPAADADSSANAVRSQVVGAAPGGWRGLVAPLPLCLPRRAARAAKIARLAQILRRHRCGLQCTMTRGAACLMTPLPADTKSAPSGTGPTAVARLNGSSRDAPPFSIQSAARYGRLARPDDRHYAFKSVCEDRCQLSLRAQIQATTGA